MAFKTLSYSESVEGFPSFYSYEPEWMIGMNNYFYTFKNGNLYRHNSDTEDRCTFYSVFGNASITGVFNQSSLQSKIFKTINLESDAPWGFVGNTDINTAGTVTIGAANFVRKEGAYFAYIRYTDDAPPVGTGTYPLRLANGIGATDNNDATNPAAQILTFPAGVEINSIPSIGDSLYFVLNPVAPPGVNNLQLMGTIIGIDRGTRQLTIDASCGLCNTPAVVVGVTEAFFSYIKNVEAESYGALGHYLQFTLTSVDTSAIELFGVKSEVMASNPGSSAR